MGFIKRLLGIEVRPGEPEKLAGSSFEIVIAQSELPCFIYFYHLWCSSCQVMGGLLNEIGPEYIGKAKFYKIDIMKNPGAAEKFGVRAVPTVLAFRDGKASDSLNSLTPLNDLKEWVERNV